MRNPQAFPKDGPPGSVQSGMSLRDWFAGQVLASGLADDLQLSSGAVAMKAYELADAMLEERSSFKKYTPEYEVATYGGSFDASEELKEVKKNDE